MVQQVFSTPEPYDSCHHKTQQETPTPIREKSQLLLQMTASFEKKKEYLSFLKLSLAVTVENTEHIEIKEN